MSTNEITDGWRPIETAPKDGTMLLLYGKLVDSETSSHFLGFWSTKWSDWFNEIMDFAEPFLWMPLPPPPAMSATEKQG